MDYEVSGRYDGFYDTCFSPSMTLLLSAHLDVLRGPEQKTAEQLIDYVAYSEEGGTGEDAT